MPAKLTWKPLPHGSGQWNGGLGDEIEFKALFILKQREDGVWVLKTSLPACYRVGVYGTPMESLEAGQELAEELLKDFYRELKKHMEPARPRKAPAAAKGSKA